jgi:hypothetical protein
LQHERLSSWVDEVIAAETDFPDALIDASLSGANHKVLVTALESCAVEPFDRRALRAFIGFLADELEASRLDEERIAHWLISLAVNGRCPGEDAESEMYLLPSLFEPEAGQAPAHRVSKVDAAERVRAFLRRWKPPAA